MLNVKALVGVIATAFVAVPVAQAGDVSTNAAGEFLVADADLYPARAGKPGKPRSTGLDLHVFSGRHDGAPPRIPDLVVVRLDRGIDVNHAPFSRCDKAQLEARGPSACQADSRVGQGSAVFDIRPLVETPVRATLRGFIGRSAVAGRARLLFHATLADGRTTVRTADVLQDPQGGRFDWAIHFISDPAFPVALTQFSFDYIERHKTVRRNGKPRRVALIEAPDRCRGGFWRFQVESYFPGGGKQTASDRAPCAP